MKIKYPESCEGCTTYEVDKDGCMTPPLCRVAFSHKPNCPCTTCLIKTVCSSYCDEANEYEEKYSKPTFSPYRAKRNY